MTFTKDKTVGIDTTIQSLQQVLHAGLLELWGLTEQDYNCYGRAYRNPIKTGHVPHVFRGGNDYGEPMLNDSKAVTSFFGIPSSTKIDRGQSIGSVHLIFFVDLSKLKVDKYSELGHRIDEEVRQDVLFVLDTNKYLCKAVGFEIWPENVLREYTSYRTDQAMKARDMHPLHMFRINLEIRYTNSNC